MWSSARSSSGMFTRVVARERSRITDTSTPAHGFHNDTTPRYDEATAKPRCLRSQRPAAPSRAWPSSRKPAAAFASRAATGTPTTTVRGPHRRAGACRDAHHESLDRLPPRLQGPSRDPHADGPCCCNHGRCRQRDRQRGAVRIAHQLVGAGQDTASVRSRVDPGVGRAGPRSRGCSWDHRRPVSAAEYTARLVGDRARIVSSSPWAS